MRTATRASALLASFLLASLAAAGGSAWGATARIGAVEEVRTGTNPAPITASQGANTWAVQIAEATGTYAVPPGYGVITAWSHSTGTVPGAVTFKVYRPRGSNQFLALAANTRNVQVDTAHEFPVRISVQPGDRIGISTTEVEVAYVSSHPSDQLGMFPFTAGDPPPGTTATQDGPPFVGYRLDVAARVETDADRDGFGDDSQDNCPTSAASQGACPGVVLPAFAGCPSLAANVIRGTRGPNTITGTLRSDRIFAGGGDDSVDSSEGGDCIDFGSGDDRGQSGSGADLLLGGSGKDRMSGNEGNDRLRGGAGADRLNGAFGDDVLNGQSGDDRLGGERGRDSIAGGSGADVIYAGSTGDRVSGHEGDDRIYGNSGDDRLAGDSGNDKITPGSGRDRVSGAGGRDRIGARDGQRDRISCGRGTDSVVADRRDRVARDCERVRRR